MKLILFVLFLTSTLVTSEVIKDYRFKLKSSCGSNISSTAHVNILTDMPVTVQAMCASGTFSVPRGNGVNFTMDVSYPGGTSECIFYKKKKVQVYVIYVTVLIDDAGNSIVHKPEVYTVSCTFDSHGSNKSESNSVPESYLAPLEIKSNAGPLSNSGVQINFTRTDGTLIPNNSTLAGKRKFRIVAMSDGAGGEVGLYPVSCDAISTNPNGMRYPVLRAGCGDGLLMAKTDGFTTTGLTTVSAPLTTFHLAKERTLKFICNFTMCMSSCDGSTCSSEVRRKRSVSLVLANKQENSGTVTLESEAVDVRRVPTVLLKAPSPPSIARTMDCQDAIVVAFFIFAVFLVLTTPTVLGMRRRKTLTSENM